ncbi:transcription factor iws-1 [Staphylotrichum tortipilum]|uniref:Transcription factor iws-1 n=1 Tax=Staphylotrichum tortipilum TaxID=2831512 RepID=A0AAN6MDS8_9PEZI|nr:transcription factor iws-1 [Staphylotrichum longicolle]
MSDANSDAGSRAGSAEPSRHSDNKHQDSPADVHDDDAGNDSDKESDLLSEIDEDQFEDYDPALEERPVEIDENVAKTLKAAKRKRADGDAAKKPKEGRRPKKRTRGAEDEVGDAEEGERRPRKTRATGGERRPARKEVVQEEQENEENLTPEERRRRAIQRAMDNALKNPTKRRRKKDEIDLEEEVDDQIAHLKVAMEKACVADNEAREKGMAATHKLKLLPQVTALLNRTSVQDSVLDPETNLLQSVKYFLEPLNDGSLPAYNIQRDIFNALAKLPINKEVLLSSGIGKVVYFYTRSKRPEVGIKRIAERLVGEWSRPILKRTDDYKKRQIETRDFDFAAAKLAQRQEAAVSGSQMTLTQRPATGGKTRFELERERMLAPEVKKTNRAAPAGLPASYTIAPRSTFDASRAPEYRPVGSAGLEAFRKMTQKGKGGGRR